MVKYDNVREIQGAHTHIHTHTHTHTHTQTCLGITS